jgi:hypothetical protein
VGFCFYEEVLQSADAYITVTRGDSVFVGRLVDVAPSISLTIYVCHSGTLHPESSTIHHWDFIITCISDILRGKREALLFEKAPINMKIEL